MKRKLFTAVMLIVVTVATVFGFAACNKNGNDETIDGAPKNIRVVAPDGTPALALFGFFNGNDFGESGRNNRSYQRGREFLKKIGRIQTFLGCG